MKWIELGKLVEQIRGVTYKKNDVTTNKKEGYVPIIRANNIQDFKFDYSDLLYIDPKKIKKEQFVKDGDIIIASSSGSKKVVGKAVQALENMDFSFGAFCKVIRIINNKVNNRYLGYYFNSDSYRNKISNLAEGANINNIRNEHIYNLKILIPPMETQDKIVEVLDQAQALIGKRKEQIETLDQLIESIFYTMFGDPIRNEKDWKVKGLKNVTSKIGSGSTPRGGESSYKKLGISLIRSMNIYDNEFRYDGLAYIDEKQAESLSNVIVKDSDILINITGASITRTTIIPKNILPARVNQHVSILRCKNQLNYIYLLHLLISKKYKQKIYYISTSGGATREALTKKDLENLEIPIPPLPLQNKFAQKVGAIEKQKVLLNKSLNLLEENYKSIMDKAFKGQLFS